MIPIPLFISGVAAVYLPISSWHSENRIIYLPVITN